MSDEIKIFKKKLADVGIVALVGDVTSLSEEQIINSYEEFADDGLHLIIFDFALVSYINSSGIAILIGIVNKAKQKGQIISVAGLAPHFQKIFKMVGLTRFIQLHDSVENALNSKGVNPDVSISN